MASGGKAAEIRAGIVVLVGLAILAVGLFLVSGGMDQWAPKNRVTVHFRDAGGIGNGADVFVAGRKAGSVAKLETVMLTRDGERGRYIAVTIEIDKDFEIPVDSAFKISKSITNVVQLNIDYGKSNKLADATTEGLFGVRLANVDELVDSYQQLAGVARKGAEEFNALISTAHEKVKQLDVQGLQGEAHELLKSLQDAAGEMRELVHGNRERIDHIVQNVDELTTGLKTDWPTMSTKVNGILDETRAAATEVKEILKENRGGLKSIVEQANDVMHRLGPAVAQIEAISRQANDAVVELRPGLTRSLAAASKAFENFEALTEDLRTAPWKLINKPSGKESDDVHLYNAARLYVTAAGDVANAIQDLETLRRLGVLGDPQRADLVQRTLTTMQEALAEFEANQKRFLSLVASTADTRK